MDDIVFPAWARSSPTLAMASVLGAFFHQVSANTQRPLHRAKKAYSDDDVMDSGSETSDIGTESASPLPMSGAAVTRILLGGARSSEVAAPAPLLVRNFSASVGVAQGAAHLYSAIGAVGDSPRVDPPGAASGAPTFVPYNGTGDVLYDARVQLLLRLSSIDDLASGEAPCVTRKHAIAILSLMALCVECRDLPSEMARGFYTECSSLYSTLMTKLHKFTFAPGVDVEGFIAALTACGLKMRGVSNTSAFAGGDDMLGGSATLATSAPLGTPVGAPPLGNRRVGGRSSNHNNASNSGLATPRTGNLSGFDSRLIDSIIVSCIPEDIDECVGDPVVLGTLQGLAGTYSCAPVYLSPTLVTRLHNLTDSFAVSGRRRELTYKRLLSLLLGAISCSEVIDYERTNNWITAIIQEDYLVRGLFQKEILHAHVAAATLTLLTRQYEDAAAECAAKAAAGGPRAADTEMPDFTEGDQLVDSVWKALQEGLGAWEGPASKVSTLYSANLRVIVEKLLQTEVERLRCYYTITSATATMTQQQPPRSRSRSAQLGLSAQFGASQNKSDCTYIPTGEEEVLRVRVVSNVVKFLLLRTSVLNVLPDTVAARRLRGTIQDRMGKVLTLIASTVLPAQTDAALPSSTLLRFSSHYYQNMVSILHELVLVIAAQGPSITACADGGAVVTTCLRSLCVADPHVHSFVVSEVMDTVVRLAAVQQDSTDDNNATAGGSEDADPQRLSLWLDLLCDVVVPKQHPTAALDRTSAVAHRDLTRYGQLLCDGYDDSLRNYFHQKQHRSKRGQRKKSSTSHSEKRNSTDAAIPTPTMRVRAKALWRLVVNLHERIRALTAEAFAAAEAGDRVRKQQCLDSLNTDGNHVRQILRGVMRTVINVAWPGSGILYQKRSIDTTADDDDDDGVEYSPQVMALLAMQCIAPLLRPLCLLSHLFTLFPVSRLSSLADHHDYARFLTADDAQHDMYVHHYQFQPSKLGSAFYTEFDTALFRSLWLLLSYYGIPSAALGITNSGRRDHSVHPQATVSLMTSQQAQQIRMLAASAVPLLLMQSTDMQQAIADITTLLRFAEPRWDVTTTSGSAHTQLRTTLSTACGGGRKYWKKLSVGELVLMSALLNLELLRASAGSMATLTLYHRFDIREYVASPAIGNVLTYITNTVCRQYISALRSMLPTISQRLVAQDTHQLVLLLSFSTDSVRNAAKSLLLAVVDALPAFSTRCGSLPLLWRVINTLEGGSAVDVEAFCESMYFNDVPAVSPEPGSAERVALVAELVAVARRWAATSQSTAPLALFDLASSFVMRQEVSGNGTAAAPKIGSRLATQAAQPTEVRLAPDAMKGVNAIGPVVSPSFSNALIKHSKAEGQVLSAVRLCPLATVEHTIFEQLRRAIRRAKRIDGVAAAPETFGYLVKGSRRNVSATMSAVVKHDPGTDAIAAQRLREVESLVTTAVALLCTGAASPSGTLQLLRYAVQGPVHVFRSDYVAAAAASWRWLLSNSVSSQHLAGPLLQQLVEAMEWTVHQHVGLFDGQRPSLGEEVQTGDTAAARAAVERYPADYGSNSPHKVLFSFLAETFVTLGSTYALNPVILSPLYRMASLMVGDASRLSLKVISFAETMRCMMLVGQIARNLHIANTRRLKAGLHVVISFTSLGLLRQRWYACLLQWFRSMPAPWHFARDPSLATDETLVLEALVVLLQDESDLLRKATLGFLDFSVVVHQNSDGGPLSSIWTTASVVRDKVGALLTSKEGAEESLKALIAKEQQRVQGLLSLLSALVQHELVRLRVWESPRRTLLITERMPTAWDALVDTAAAHDPAVMVAMVARFASYLDVFRLASRHVVRAPLRFSHIPEAAELYLTKEVLEAGAPKLFLFTNCGIVQALRLLDTRYKPYPAVETYAIRSLLSQKSESLVFYLPQLLQVLAADKSGQIQSFLLRMSHKSLTFCHQLLWSLQTEGEADSVLGKKCKALEGLIKSEFTSEQHIFYKGEFEFTNLVTSLSGELMKYEKSQRKPKVRERLKDNVFHDPPRTQHLYLPTDPAFRIVDVVSHTASAMQSAAKCPIFVQFKCVPRDTDDSTPPPQVLSDDGGDINSAEQQQQVVMKACIFKMGDDCRQDQISLQLIGLMQRILNSIDVPSYLYPYRVVTTGQESGIIECVPHSMSRNEIGKLVESNLAEFFVQTFGHPESVRFRRARDNFVKSAASYSVVSYILNIKDRHNGNIMVDSEGHLVHIDFGFLFDTSPGGDMNFESSPFKLTTEMVQLIGRDVGSSNLRSPSLSKALVDEESYVYFKTLINRCYLAIRQYSREICVLVELMLRSGLPCFKPHKTISDLAKRLAMGKNEIEAADFMRKRIHEARENYRTVLYDTYQRIAEGIEM